LDLIQAMFRLNSSRERCSEYSPVLNRFHAAARIAALAAIPLTAATAKPADCDQSNCSTSNSASANSSTGTDPSNTQVPTTPNKSDIRVFCTVLFTSCTKS